MSPVLGLLEHKFPEEPHCSFYKTKKQLLYIHLSSFNSQGVWASLPSTTVWGHSACKRCIALLGVGVSNCPNEQASWVFVNERGRDGVWMCRISRNGNAALDCRGEVGPLNQSYCWWFSTFSSVWNLPVIPVEYWQIISSSKFKQLECFASRCLYCVDIYVEMLT